MEEKQDVKYASFSTRVLAVAIDLSLVTILLSPISPRINSLIFDGIHVEQFIIDGSNRVDMSAMLSYLSNQNFFITYFLVQLATVAFILGCFLFCWLKFGNTPGKWILGYKIVDTVTLQPPTRRQYIKRVLGYFASGVPFCLGFFTMHWTDKKQCWHDKIAHTVVIKVKHDFSWLKGIKDYISSLKKHRFTRFK